MFFCRQMEEHVNHEEKFEAWKKEIEDRTSELFDQVEQCRSSFEDNLKECRNFVLEQV